MRRILLLTLFISLITHLVACAPRTPCPWNWTYRNGPPELNNQLNQALTDAGLIGTISAMSFGETGGDDCSYHEMSIYVHVTLQVTDLSDLKALTKLENATEKILKKTTPPSQLSLTDSMSTLTFTDGEKECRWNVKADACY